MPDSPPCPQCHAEFTYLDGALYVCPSCAHEWSPKAAESAADDGVVRDANENVLQDGDSVIVIKDLKVKGSSLHCKGR